MARFTNPPAGSGGSQTIIAETEPTPANGSFWLDSSDYTLYICVNGVWVNLVTGTPPPPPPPSANSILSQYNTAVYDSSWSTQNNILKIVEYPGGVTAGWRSNFYPMSTNTITKTMAAVEQEFINQLNVYYTPYDITDNPRTVAAGDGSVLTLTPGEITYVSGSYTTHFFLVDSSGYLVDWS